VLAAVVAALVILGLVASARPASPSATSGPPTAVDASRSPVPDGSGKRAVGSELPSGSVATSDSPATATPPATASATRPPATPRPTPAATSHPTAGCTPTDQDRYVYNPTRLEVLAACVRVTGTVAAVRREADGDLHILLDLDAPHRDLLRPANQGEELGDLVVEPVCVRGVTQADAIDVCASDPDPMTGPFPSVGDHVWMEGRYVLDLQHGGWAELHPLYRWGSA